MGQITVGLPTFNNEKTIRQTIASLRDQNFKHWNCVLVDDCSTDLTVKVALEQIDCDKRFKVVNNSERLGAAANWNKTLHYADSKYFKLLCGDDVISESCLQIQLNSLEENPTCSISVGLHDVINSQGKYVRSGTNFFGEPSFVLFRTSALVDGGGFDNNWSYLIDTSSYFNSLKFGDLISTGENLGSFRVSSTSWSSNLATTQLSESLEFIEYVFKLSEIKMRSYEKYMGISMASIRTLLRKVVFSKLHSLR
jgi:glycosyltransferase involved in cell wall biosynthesis